MKNTMKKWIALAMALLFLLSLAACGGNNPNEIPITLENYNKYLKFNEPVIHDSTPFDDNVVNVEYMTGSKGILLHGDSIQGRYTYYALKSLIISASAEGISQNFNYNDIQIIGKLKVKCQTCDLKKNSNGIYAFDGVKELDVDIILNLDITGNASFQEEVPIGDGLYTHHDLLESEFEIISITGTVTPA